MGDLVSIVVPSYNCAKYLPDTINSVLKQTYTNWEMLIVDDCSTDNSEEVIRSFGDPRIWNIVGRLAGCLGLAKALEAAGGTKIIADTFAKLVGTSFSPFLLFAILVLLVLVVSEFMSNSTAILIVLPIVIAISPELGLNSYTFAMGITLASGICVSCPLASSTLGMSMTCGYRFNDYFRYGFLMDILAYITIVVLVPMFYGLTV